MRRSCDGHLDRQATHQTHHRYELRPCRCQDLEVRFVEGIHHRRDHLVLTRPDPLFVERVARGQHPADMRSLITGIANGSDSRASSTAPCRTFTRVSKGTDGPVAIGGRPTLRTRGGSDRRPVEHGPVASAAGWRSPCCSSVSRSSHRTARHPRERTPNRQGSMSGGWPTRPRETKAERQTAGEPLPTEKRPTYAEPVGLESDLHAGIPARAPEDGDPQATKHP